MMRRWTGLLTSGKPHPFKISASLLLSPSSDTLLVPTIFTPPHLHSPHTLILANSSQVPSLNAIFFTGDRVEGTGNPVIERLSDLSKIAELIVLKLGEGANVWVVEAARFNGPFAVYSELVPSVNELGDPRGYDADGFPASSSIVALLSDCVEQVRNVVSGRLTRSTMSNMYIPPSPPKTVILGFSKGGTVVNQLITEFAHLKSDTRGDAAITGGRSNSSLDLHGPITPVSVETLLSSIAEFHYVDVGLNCPGAYLTDQALIKKVAHRLSQINCSILFAFHGTPRQWCDHRRSWICKEKDRMKQLLEGEAHRHEGRLQVIEKLYFAGKPPDLQMHFEIIEALDIG